MYYLVFYYLLNLELPPVNEMFLQHFRRLWSTNFFSKHINLCTSKTKQCIACLFGHHHFDEFFVIDMTITIDIGFTDHFIDFFVGQFFTQIGHDVTKFGGGDKTISILVKDFEGFENFWFNGLISFSRRVVYYYYCYNLN